MNPMDIMLAGSAGNAPTAKPAGPLDMLRQTLQSRVRSQDEMGQLDEAQTNAREKFRQSAQSPLSSVSGPALMLASYMKNMQPGQSASGLGAAIAAPTFYQQELDKARFAANMRLGEQEVNWANTDCEEGRKESFDAMKDLAVLERDAARASSGQIGKFVPVPGIPGMMVNNINPLQQIDMRDAATNEFIRKTFNTQRALYATDEEAMQAAFAAAAKTKGPTMTPPATNVAAPQGALAQAAPAEAALPVDVNRPATTEAPGVALAGLDTQALAKSLQGAPAPDVMEIVASLPPEQKAQVERFLRQAAQAKAAGNTALAEKRMGQVAEIAGFPPRKDLPKEAGRETTEKEAAKMYANSFEEAVVKPAVAFSNTGKIMQDFNNIGQMQFALKNGKLKEFMAGDTGKWALSLLPAGSDLSKGIANAQEAEKLTAGMVNQILMAAKGVQTEGDAERARSQVTQIGANEDANRYVEAYVNETARQLKMREQMGRAYKKENGTYEGYDSAWTNSPLMTQAKGSVKRVGKTWVGITQYIDKFKAKNPGANELDAINSWNGINDGQ